MNDKLVRDLVLDSTGATSFQSEAVPIGSNNCAMFEVWVKSKLSNPTTNVELQGSNDRQNWTAVAGLGTVAASTLPSYDRNTQYVDAIPYEYVMLSFSLSGTGAMLLDSSRRMFTTGG